MADFFSPEAGQARRNWLNSIDDRIAEGLRYYLGPSGVDQNVNALARGGQMLMDGTDYLDAYSAGGNLMQSRSIPEAAANFLEFAAPAAAVMIPGVSNRMLQGAGDMAEDAARFVVDESGALRLMGGGESDPTDLGWTFKEVGGPIPLTKAENNWLRGGMKGSTTTELPIRSLTATQAKVNPDYATTTTSAGELPFVVRKNGEFYVRDGHHRLTKLSEEGAQNARVELVDFDGADTSTPLLDYDPVKVAKQNKEDEDLLAELFDLGMPDRPPSPAQQVADLLASGRAADVTDEMLAKLTPNDNAELFKLYQSGATGADMPMDVASRMQRAEGLGVDTGTPLYRGTDVDLPDYGRNISSAEGGDGITFMTDERRTANTYASPKYRNAEGGNVQPLFAKLSGFSESGYTKPFPDNGTEAQIDDWMIGNENFNRRLDFPESAKSNYFNREIARAKTSGSDGVVIRQVEDDKIPMHNTTPSDVYASFDPRNIRSRFARFDPRLSHLANLSAAGAGVAVINGQDDTGWQNAREQFRAWGMID